MVLIGSPFAVCFDMNNLATGPTSAFGQLVIFKRKHMQLMIWMYVGAFGSFICLSARSPLLIKFQCPDVDPTPYVSLDSRIGGLFRPVGGRISDKLGCARVTLWAFATMAVGMGVLRFIDIRTQFDLSRGFLVMFMVLFPSTNASIGSAFRMIPSPYLSIYLRKVELYGDDTVESVVAKEPGMCSAAVLGFSSAITAYGTFFIPKSLGTWWYSTRKKMRQSLTESRVWQPDQMLGVNK